MNYLHSEFDLRKGDVVEVALTSQANVLLLDSSNFDSYQRNKGYRYYGGLAKQTPVRLSPPRPGRWHLVVDLGGYAGEVRADVQVFKAQEAVL